jgi:hypothetical protein
LTAACTVSLGELAGADEGTDDAEEPPDGVLELEQPVRANATEANKASPAAARQGTFTRILQFWEMLPGEYPFGAVAIATASP